MSKAQHTRAPWHVDTDPRQGGCDQVVAADDTTVAFIATGRPQEEHEANAAMCAAAPNLLAALEEISAEYEAYRQDDNLIAFVPPTGWHKRCVAALKLAGADA